MILSYDNRMDDTLRKTDQYRRAQIGQFTSTYSIEEIAQIDQFRGLWRRMSDSDNQTLSGRVTRRE